MRASLRDGFTSSDPPRPVTWDEAPARTTGDSGTAHISGRTYLARIRCSFPAGLSVLRIPMNQLPHPPACSVQ